MAQAQALTHTNITQGMPFFPPLMSHRSVSHPGAVEQNHPAITHISDSEFILSSVLGVCCSQHNLLYCLNVCETYKCVFVYHYHSFVVVAVHFFGI